MSIVPSRSLALVAAWITVGLATCGTSFAQAPADPPTIRDYCVKVTGKVADYEAYLKDVTLPVARARAEAGDFQWFIVAKGVFPSGSSAPCDYRLVYGYKGLPPEAASRDTLAAALKRAKLTISVDEMVARRDALTHLVGVDLWYGIGGVGSDVVKDNYIALNHNTVKDGQFAEWQKLELTYWKPLVEAWLKAGGKGAWSISSLRWPTGTSAPYSSLSVDVFQDWNSLVRGVPLDTLWPKVHPNITSAEVFEKLAKTRSVHDQEIYKVFDVVEVTKSSSAISSPARMTPSTTTAQ
jgi:hypothetical protein